MASAQTFPILSHRGNYHDVSRIDGLLAAIVFIDTLYNTLEPSSNDPGGRLKPPNQIPSVLIPEARTHRQGNDQWERLDSFRQQSDIDFAKLQSHYQDHGCECLASWLNEHPNAHVMRKEGIFQLRQLYNGGAVMSMSRDALLAAMVLEYSIWKVSGSLTSARPALFEWKDPCLDNLSHCVRNRLFSSSSTTTSPSEPRPPQVPDNVVKGSGEQFTELPVPGNSRPDAESPSNWQFFGSSNTLSFLPSGVAPFGQSSVDIFNQDVDEAWLSTNFPSPYSTNQQPALGFGAGGTRSISNNQGYFTSNEDRTGIPGYSSTQRLGAFTNSQLRHQPPFESLCAFLNEFDPNDSILAVFSTDSSEICVTNQMSSHQKDHFLDRMRRHLIQPFKFPDKSWGPIYSPIVKAIGQAADVALVDNLLSDISHVEWRLRSLARHLLPRGHLLDNFDSIVREAIKKDHVEKLSRRVQSSVSQQTPDAILINLDGISPGLWTPHVLLHKFSIDAPASVRYLGTPSAITGTEISDNEEVLSQAPTLDSGVGGLGGSKTCPICFKEYRGANAATNLSRHKRKHLSCYQCPVCKEEATRSDNLKTHIKSRHPGEPIPKGRDEWAKYRHERIEVLGSM